MANAILIAMNKKIIKIAGFLPLFLSIVAGGIIFKGIFSADIWYDEVFSLCFTEGGFFDVIALTARDVHPPFYYLYLKTVSGIILFLTNSSNVIMAGKLASILPLIILLIISLTYIRNKWGMLTAGMFMLLITAMPQIGNYYIEIRMYSLALLLITVAGLLALSILENESQWKWFFLWLTGILTAYTQYYACIGVAGVYMALLCLILLRKDNDKKKLLRAYGICVINSIIFYIPWLPVVIKQMNNLQGNYWIQPLTLRSLAGCVKFILLPVSGDGIIRYIAVVLVLISFVILGFVNIKKDGIKKYYSVLAMGIIPIALVIASGFILSAMGTPIFVYRYMLPVIGLVWLLVSIFIEKAVDKHSIWIILIIPFLLCGFLNMRGFYYEENKKAEHMEETMEVLNRLPREAVIITNFDHVTSVAAYYLRDADIYLYGWDVDNLIKDMLNVRGSELSDEDVKELVKGDKPVYFFGSFNSREEILAEWENHNITGVEENSLLLERYWFNIYILGLK